MNAAAAAPLTRKQRLERIFYFFPFQLLLAHLKRNHLLLIFWLFLFAVVTQNLGNGYGIPYLFLYPEYLGGVNFFSHLLLGTGIGGFVMAFNMASYIINSHRFPFIATLAKPFLKYSINNFIIPLSFWIIYLIQLVRFQLYSELEPLSDVIGNLAGFILGNVLFITFGMVYFVSTNKNLKKLFGVDPEKVDRKIKSRPRYSPIRGGFHRKEQWNSGSSREWRVDTYLAHPMKISLARECVHYDRSMLRRVFAQNHINASYFEIGAIITILILGIFREIPLLMIPAGASLVLFFTMVLMFASALHSWLRGWSTVLFIGLLIGLNFVSQFPGFRFTNAAYGLDYSQEKTPYNYKVLSDLRDDTLTQQKDFAAHLQVLDRWRQKNTPTAELGTQKPKLVLISTSGGGLRSSMWTFVALQQADSLLNGKLLSHTHLITGSSGGMIGAAYLRELYLQKQTKPSINLYADSLNQRLARDILNPVVVTLAVNDLFVRFQSFEEGNNVYTKDRAYAFEQQLHHNTDWVMDKRMRDYVAPESASLIPTMVLAPTIANDGRKLLISSQPISYLCSTKPMPGVSNEALVESWEFNRFFASRDPLNLRFSTALRMSATFPYITPNVSLPTEPELEVLDAGIRDNFGLHTTVRFLYTFREWIAENTSGVVILQIRDQQKVHKLDARAVPKTLAGNLLSPLGHLYRNLTNIQTFNQDELLQYASLWSETSIDVVNLELQFEKENGISLSWHLTTREKKQIKNGLHCDHNQAELQRLVELLH